MYAESPTFLFVLVQPILSLTFKEEVLKVQKQKQHMKWSDSLVADISDGGKCLDLVSISVTEKW